MRPKGYSRWFERGNVHRDRSFDIGLESTSGRKKGTKLDLKVLVTGVETERGRKSHLCPVEKNEISDH